MAKSLEEIFGNENRNMAQSSESTSMNDSKRKSLERIFSEAPLPNQNIRQESSSLSEQPISMSPMQPNSPTNFAQDLILSFAPNDEVRARFLMEEFKGKNISQDEKGNLTIDGVRVNPKGFDSGDITRNIGNVIPFATQILATMGGAATGAFTGGTTSMPAAVAMGTGGAVLGRSAQLAIGKTLGLDPNGKDVFFDLATEAVASSTGEIGGHALGFMAKKFGLKKFYKGVSDLWIKSLKNMDSSIAPKVAEFLGGVRKQFTARAQEKGYNKSLADKFFDPNHLSKVINRTLFGKETVNFIDNFVGATPIKKGIIDILDSAKSLGNREFDEVIKIFSGGTINDDILRASKDINLKELVNPVHTASTRSAELGNKVVKGIQSNVEGLGKQLGKAESKAIRNIGKQTFDLSNVTSKIEKLTDSLGITKDIIVPGFQRSKSIAIKGMKELEEIAGIFKKKPIGNDTLEFLPSVKVHQSSNLMKKFNLKVDEFFLKKDIPTELKDVVRQIATEFRDSYYNRLGIVDEAKGFRAFQEIMDGIKITDAAGSFNERRSMEQLIKGFNKRSFTETNRLDIILDNIQGGQALKRSIQKHNLAMDLSKISPSDIVKNAENILSREDILLTGASGIQENILKSLDDRLFLNPKTKARAFYDEAENSLIAREFSKGSPNILRVSTVAGMLGLSGFLSGGGAAGGAGLVAGLALTNPKTIGNILKAGERKAIRKGAKRAISDVTKKKVSAVPAVLKALTTRALKGNQ